MRKWSNKLLLIGLSFVVTLIISEIVLRIAGVTYPSFYVYDDYRGNALEPGAEGWWRREGEAYVKIQ